jgi:hypothetical protein
MKHARDSLAIDTHAKLNRGSVPGKRATKQQPALQAQPGEQPEALPYV